MVLDFSTHLTHQRGYGLPHKKPNLFRVPELWNAP